MVADADTARDTLIIELRDTLNELLGVLQEREDEPVPNTTQELLEQVQEQRGRRELPEAVRTPFNLSPVPEGVGQPAGGTELSMRRQRRTADDLDLGYREMFPEEGEGFWARITGHTSDGDNQWTYSWEQVEKTSTGYGEWAAVSPSVAGTDNAYNTLEDMNAATGTQGNGVDADNLDTDDFTFTIQPCPAGAIVRLHELGIEGEDDPEFWFAYANGVDGECD